MFNKLLRLYVLGIGNPARIRFFVVTMVMVVMLLLVVGNVAHACYAGSTCPCPGC